MKEQSKGEVLTIGVDSKADLTAEGIDVSADGTAFDMLWQGKRYPVHLHTPGRFSVYNALGAAGACILLGVPVEEIVAGLTGKPRRFRQIPDGTQQKGLSGGGGLCTYARWFGKCAEYSE